MRGIVRSGAAALVLLLAGSGGAGAADRLKIVMSSFGFHYLPIFTAADLGYLKDEGIEAEFAQTGGGAKAMAAVIGGDADIYMGTPTTVFRARMKGTDAYFIGAMLTQFGSNFVASKEWAEKHGLTPSSTYEQRLAAVKGMRIGVTSAGSGTDQMVHFVAKQAGIDYNRDVQVIGLGTGDANLAALAQGRIDGFLYNAPTFAVAMRNQGAYLLFDTLHAQIKELDGFLYGGVVVRESWVKQHPDLAVRTLRALQRGLDADHSPALTAKARDAVHAHWYPKIDKAFFAELWERQVPAYPKSVVVEQKSIDIAVKFVNEFEKTPLDQAAVKSGWTNEYAQKAVATMKN